MTSGQVEKLPSVLLVDDDPHARAIFVLLAEHFRIPFAIAPDTQSALEYLRERKPDIIVIDLFLPETDGYKLLGEISPLIDRTQCRILATTAYYTKDTEQAVLERGFDGYIQKPFIPDSFLGELNKVLE